MANLIPVSAPNAAPVESAGAGMGTTAGTQSGSVSERKLHDYMAELQAQASLNGKATHLANPAALGGETLRLLQGYFDRAGKIQDLTAKKARFMSEDASGGVKAAQGDERPQHAGPARQHLEPAGQSSGSAPSGGVQPVLGDAEFARTADMLMRVLSFAVETNLVATGAGAISKSANTLLRGQ